MNSMEPSLPLTKAKQLRSVSHTHTPPFTPLPRTSEALLLSLSASLCLGLSTPAPGYPGSPTAETAQQVQGHWFQHQTESRQLFSSTQDSSRQCLKLCSNFHLQQLKTVWSVWSPVVSSRYNTEWNYVPQHSCQPEASGGSQRIPTYPANLMHAIPPQLCLSMVGQSVFFLNSLIFLSLIIIDTFPSFFPSPEFLISSFSYLPKLVLFGLSFSHNTLLLLRNYFFTCLTVDLSTV